VAPLGRIVEAISHSNVWATSAIFVEEDDAQDGVDHVDGHRQPVYIIRMCRDVGLGTFATLTWTLPVLWKMGRSRRP
jgi:hypothetical protein